MLQEKEPPVGSCFCLQSLWFHDVARELQVQLKFNQASQLCIISKDQSLDEKCSHGDVSLIAAEFHVYYRINLILIW